MKARSRKEPDWESALRFLPILQAAGFRAGTWRSPPGVVPWFEYTPEVTRFVNALHEAGIIRGFDWPAWQGRARRLCLDRDALGRASMATLRKLLTLHVRKDRFREGHLAAVLESGHIAAILNRVARLQSRRRRHKRPAALRVKRPHVGPVGLGLQSKLPDFEAIRNMTPPEIRAAVNGFPARYFKDWEAWTAADPDDRIHLFGKTLRKWQATRPLRMRRPRREADHEAPYLDDLLESAAKPLRVLADLSLITISQRSPAEERALSTLWDIFSRLPIRGFASCVGITKAVLLLTDGRIGPAFDSQVRKRLRIRRPETCREWLQALDRIAEDIAAFEAAHGSLKSGLPPRFRKFEYGRLSDMILGPR